jgi:hypothetical protein
MALRHFVQDGLANWGVPGVLVKARYALFGTNVPWGGVFLTQRAKFRAVPVGLDLGDSPFL